MTKLIFSVALVGCSTSAAHDAAKGDSGSAVPTAVDSRPLGAIDDMIAIPSGYYPWDTRTCNKTADYERTARTYQIDRKTVLCADYRACIKAKRCPSYGHNTCTYNNATVTREAAAKYCAWRGAELPSTGQWQKASRKDGRFFPNGYVFDLLHTCTISDPGTQYSDRERAIAMQRCIYTSPYGMDVPLLQSTGEWTRDDSCPSEADETPRPLAVGLKDRLDLLVTPVDPYQEFRCVRTE
jgi:hypothetical protein